MVGYTWFLHSHQWCETVNVILNCICSWLCHFFMWFNFRNCSCVNDVMMHCDIMYYDVTRYDVIFISAYADVLWHGFTWSMSVFQLWYQNQLINFLPCRKGCDTISLNLIQRFQIWNYMFPCGLIIRFDFCLCSSVIWWDVT